MSDRIKKLSAPLPANATIGMVGGGQLGRMMASSAAQMGYKLIVLEPGDPCPTSQLANEHIVAAYDDEAALEQLAACCDVVTYEFENVPLSAAHFLETRVPLYPPSRALEVSQDRLVEKTALRDAGIKVADFIAVENEEDLSNALKQFDGGVLKTRRFGYDGKGQMVFGSGETSFDEGVLENVGAGPYILEQRIAFNSEFSVIAARGIDGSIECYDPATNEHRNGILARSVVPASLKNSQHEEAVSVARLVLESLDYVGVVGVEFFATDGALLVNEIAPRVHNSGHWTREACLISQFDQHIRAVCGMALGSPKRDFDCEMFNLIGDDVDDLRRWMDDGNCSVTLYGKEEARSGRKMGHVTRRTGIANAT